MSQRGTAPSPKAKKANNKLVRVDMVVIVVIIVVIVSRVTSFLKWGVFMVNQLDHRVKATGGENEEAIEQWQALWLDGIYYSTPKERNTTNLSLVNNYQVLQKKTVFYLLDIGTRISSCSFAGT